MSFNFPPPPSSLPPDPRKGITQSKTEGGKTEFTRKFREGLPNGEDLPFGAGPGNPINNGTLNISGFGKVVANSTNSTINGEGRVSVSFEKGSKNNTFNLSNTTGEKTTATIALGADNNTLNFKQGLPPSPADINNSGKGTVFSGGVGGPSRLDNFGSDARIGSAGQPFQMGAGSQLNLNQNGQNAYVNVVMGGGSQVLADTSIANGSVFNLGEGSRFIGGPNLYGDFTIKYTGSSAHSSSTPVYLPGYTKVGQTDPNKDPNGAGDIYEKRDENDESVSRVTVYPGSSAGGPPVITDPSIKPPAWDTPLGM